MPCNVTWRAAASWQTVAHALFHSELSRAGALPILFFDMDAIQPFRLGCLPKSTNGREAIRRVTLMSLRRRDAACRVSKRRARRARRRRPPGIDIDGRRRARPSPAGGEELIGDLVGACGARHER